MDATFCGQQESIQNYIAINLFMPYRWAIKKLATCFLRIIGNILICYECMKINKNTYEFQYLEEINYSAIFTII